LTESKQFRARKNSSMKSPNSQYPSFEVGH
jgi:hypothetical protein